MAHAHVTAELRPIFADFESRSRAKLSGKGGVGGRVYAEHPSTEVVCCCLTMPDRVKIEWSPFRRTSPDPTRALQHWTKLGHPVAAHSGVDFDRHLWLKLQWPTPRKFVDTSELARVAGMPKADLDWLLTNLLGYGKDLEGSKLTKKLSVPSRRKADFGALPVITPEVLERVIEYCRSDVDGLEELYDEHLAEWQGLDVEGYEEAQRIVNDRGVRFDRELAALLLEADAELGARAVKEARVPRTLVSSPPQFRAELERLGVIIPDAKKQTITRLTADLQDPAWIRERKLETDGFSPKQISRLIRARQATSSIAAGKLRAGLLRCSADGMLRDSTRYYGAHTGRESGRGVQLHNLAKGPALVLDETIAELLSGSLWMHVEAKGKPGEKGYKPREWKPLDASGVNTLLRACLMAEQGCVLAVCDWSQVEGRGLAWAADDRDALKRFRRYDAGDKNADPYKVLAAIIYGILAAEVDGTQRQVGKIGELGCGYQMGPDRFHIHAVTNGVDWSELNGLTAKDVVKAWRALHEAIVSFWYEMQDAAIAVTAGWKPEVQCGPFRWVKFNGLVMNQLPSGRVIVYQGMSAAKSEDKWGKKRWSLKYVGRKGSEHTYGGKLVENAIQAMCACILREGLVEAERAGLRPVLTIHDEIACSVPKREGPAAYAELQAIMKRKRSWAEGLPIQAEGFISERYQKSA